MQVEVRVGRYFPFRFVADARFLEGSVKKGREEAS
jgi:hypothetical protein